MIKFIIAIVMLWMFGVLLSGVIEGFGVHPEEGSTLATLMNFQLFEWKDVWGVISLPVPNLGWFGAFATIFTWDLAIFEGDYEIARWLLTAASIGLGVMLMIMLIQIVRG